ncbi:MAG: AraC family transcriptional regulator [Saprospiraceae bacterium]|nr:AraC family transcriptional regulator [Saprospiraceae bacterium]
MGRPAQESKGESFASLLECDTIRYSRHRFPWHLHPGYYSFSLVIDGRADLVFHDQLIPVEAGDIVFIPDNAPHQTIVEDFFTNVIIRVNSTLTSNVFGYSEKSLLIRKPYAIDLFLRWYEQLRQLRSSGIQLHLIKAFIQDMSALQEEEGFEESQEAGQLDVVRAYLHQHYGQPIQLQQLSQVSHMSPSHFQRRFRQTFGISPIRYLQSLRVDRAKGLIKQDFSMTQVAYETGFYDQSHFNKYFKLLTGMAPSRYQAIIQND